MSHAGESALDVTEISLKSIANQRLRRNISLPRTILNSDWGYNDTLFFEFLAQADLGFMNTMKRSAFRPFKFGKVGYKCNREQQVIPEKGRMTDYAANRSLSSIQQYFTAY